MQFLAALAHRETVMNPGVPDPIRRVAAEGRDFKATFLHHRYDQKGREVWVASVFLRLGEERRRLRPPWMWRWGCEQP